MKQNKNKSLLEQIRTAPKNQHRDSPKLDPDVALAWIKGEVSVSQIGKILWPERGGNSTSYTYTFLVRSMREAYNHGRIKIV